MSNPFDGLFESTEKSKQRESEELAYDEWSGQFSCLQAGCNGWANIAKYFPREHTLIWLCAEGHRSILDDVHE